MEIIFGLTAAIGWGVADFCARFGSRRIGAYRTLMYMQPFGMIAIPIYLTLTGGWSHFGGLGWRPWAFAAIAGLMNTLASLALYHAFEIGTMSVAAPVSSAYPAVTVTLALLSGERITPMHAVGLAVIFFGIILAALSFAQAPSASSQGGASRDSASARVVRGAGWAFTSAVGFGVMFWWLGFHVVKELGGPVSVWVVRLVMFFSLLIAAPISRRNIAIPTGGVWWTLTAIGLIDTTAFIANNSGMQIGHVSVVSVLSSLYGAVTVLLGGIFVREYIAKSQWCGVALIFAGIVLVNL
jgi:drug/metabolite transporter (DMT)-like permease